jgi:hypothetical protein
MFAIFGELAIDTFNPEFVFKDELGFGETAKRENIPNGQD